MGPRTSRRGPELHCHIRSQQGINEGTWVPESDPILPWNVEMTVIPSAPGSGTGEEESARKVCGTGPSTQQALTSCGLLLSLLESLAPQMELIPQ